MDNTQYERLRATAVFGGLSQATLDLLTTDDLRVRHAPGEYFFREGEPGESLFLLESGEVEIVRDWQGIEHVLAKLSSGDCFGEMALIEIGPRSASVRAAGEATALEITSTAIHQLLASDLEQFTLLQMNLGREVSRRLRKADDRLFEVRVQAAQRDGAAS